MINKPKLCKKDRLGFWLFVLRPLLDDNVINSVEFNVEVAVSNVLNIVKNNAYVETRNFYWRANK